MVPPKPTWGVRWRGIRRGLLLVQKVGVPESELGNVAGLVERSMNASLKRLGLDHVDLFQLHNTIGEADRHGMLTAAQVLEEVVPAFEKLKDAGKTRYLGFTAKGSTEQLHQLVQCNACLLYTSPSPRDS